MKPTDFWNSIGSYVDFDEEGSSDVSRLETYLASLSAGDIEAWSNIFVKVDDDCRSAGIRDACFIIDGGLSDDVFEDFRAGLIAHGREVVDAALSSPDSLADLIDTDDIGSEDMHCVADNAYRRLTGGQMDYAKRKTRKIPPLEDERVLRKKYPKLYAKFWDL